MHKHIFLKDHPNWMANVRVSSLEPVIRDDLPPPDSPTPPHPDDVLLTASRVESPDPPTPTQSEPASELPPSLNLSTDLCTDPPTPSQLDPIYGTQEQVLMNRVNTALKELRRPVAVDPEDLSGTDSDFPAVDPAVDPAALGETDEHSACPPSYNSDHTSSSSLLIGGLQPAQGHSCRESVSSSGLDPDAAPLLEINGNLPKDWTTLSSPLIQPPSPPEEPQSIPTLGQTRVERNLLQKEKGGCSNSLRRYPTLLEEFWTRQSGPSLRP